MYISPSFFAILFLVFLLLSGKHTHIHTLVYDVRRGLRELGQFIPLMGNIKSYAQIRA